MDRNRNRRPQLDSALTERRAEFVTRIRTLRRKRFDVQWQKRLTKLSGMISSSETRQSLDRIDSQIRELEKEVK